MANKKQDIKDTDDTTNDNTEELVLMTKAEISIDVNVPLVDVSDLKNMSVQQLAARQQLAKAVNDKMDTLRKMYNAEVDLIRKELLPEKMEEEEIEGIKVQGVGTVSLNEDIFVHVPKDKKDELHQWLKDNNLGPLIQSSAAANTVKAEIKRRMEAAETLPPPDVAKVTPYTFSKVPLLK